LPCRKWPFAMKIAIYSRTRKATKPPVCWLSFIITGTARHLVSWTMFLFENNTLSFVRSGWRQCENRRYRNVGRCRCDKFIRNNIFALICISAVQVSRVKEHLSYTFMNNIIYQDSGEFGRMGRRQRSQNKGELWSQLLLGRANQNARLSWLHIFRLAGIGARQAQYSSWSVVCKPGCLRFQIPQFVGSEENQVQAVWL
jgi:hypothetical protein